MDIRSDYYKEEVDQLLRSQYSSIGCIICGQTPMYKIIPQQGIPLTAEIQDRGVICQYCVSMKYLDPAQYGLRPLNPPRRD